MVLAGADAADTGDVDNGGLLGVVGLGGLAGRGGLASRGLVLLLALLHVGTGALEGGEDGVLVAVDDGVVGAAGVVVVVALVLVGAGGLVGVVALELDRVEGGVEVAVLLDVLVVPVHLTTGPVDSTLSVAGEATGPDGELESRGGLGELEVLRGGVPGILLQLGAADLAVDEPLNLLGGPADLVVVEVGKGVGEGNVGRVFI